MGSHITCLWTLGKGSTSVFSLVLGGQLACWGSREGKRWKEGPSFQVGWDHEALEDLPCPTSGRAFARLKGGEANSIWILKA